jgi:Spy/CpxP family protein refolding chaperone
MKDITRLKLWLAVAAVFALGCATGALLDSAYRLRAGAARGESRGGRHNPEHMFEKMRRELALDERQSAEVRKILDETRNEYRALRTELRPRFEEPRLKARARIREVLNEEQRRKFDAQAAERDAKRGEHERGERERDERDRQR